MMLQWLIVIGCVFSFLRERASVRRNLALLFLHQISLLFPFFFLTLYTLNSVAFSGVDHDLITTAS